jgi:hypothetical protein
MELAVGSHSIEFKLTADAPCCHTGSRALTAADRSPIPPEIGLGNVGLLAVVYDSITANREHI